MRRLGVFALIFIALFVILSARMISANTIIVGKVYDSDYATAISGASVNVKCSSTSFNTTSKDDGLYFVIFVTGVCDNETTVIVTANKNGLTGTKTGITHDCDGNGECDTGNLNTTIEFYSVINPALVTPSSSDNGGSSGGGGGSSGLYYLCGNGVCDSGETSATCPMDCPVAQTLSNQKGEEDKTTTPTETQTQTNGLPGITGGVILDFAKSGGGIATLIALLLVIVLAIIIFSMGKNRKLKNKPAE